MLVWQIVMKVLVPLLTLLEPINSHRIRMLKARRLKKKVKKITQYIIKISLTKTTGMQIDALYVDWVTNRLSLIG